MPEGATYVYAVAEITPTAGLRGLRGIAGQPVRVVEAAGLVAVVSTVSFNDFGAESLQRNLEDLRWLERTARAHHAVVQAVASQAPTVPLRMATIYLDDERVRELLQQRHTELVAALDRIRGRTEWGVKVFADVTDPPPESEADQSDSSRPGTAYLQRRRMARQHVLHRRAELAERAEAVHTAFADLALASRQYPPQDHALSGAQDEMLLNAAYLVEESAEQSVREIARTHTGSGLRVELTGPWAPYSFAELDES